MNRLQILKSALIGGASVLTLVNPAAAKVFDIPNGDLAAALGAYMQQAGVEIVYSDAVVRGHRTQGARGNFTETAALTQILQGTGFTTKATANAIGIVPEIPKPRSEELRVAQARRAAPALAPAQAGVETVVVTAQKKSENIQQVPIAVTALSQAQLTDRQIAAGPDLIRDVPNMNFTKTNFTGYNIELRGIGTQAISVTTDPAVAVAYNGIPFLRNHFFEQEFFDLDNVEVLRGPQGTLYGRNATAGVVNLIPALPTDQFEAMGSVDIGNYMNHRLEGMINLPIAGDKLDIRLAGEWTKRNGYTLDTTLNQDVDGRDLWSGRVTIGFKPTEDLQTYLVWEHFSEDDDRLRSGKQLCKTAESPASVDGQPVPPITADAEGYGGVFRPTTFLNQGCVPTSLYSPDAFEVPNGYSAQYVKAGYFIGFLNPGVDPYAEATQSTNLRDIESIFLPHYRAKNDLVEFNADYKITPALTLTSQTGYNKDFLYSTEDFNRFNTSPGIFLGGPFCDPQLGCTDRLVGEDLSDENSWQVSQELRLASNFSGPLNFDGGVNYLHYETEENYYVFINTLTDYLTGANYATGIPVTVQNSSNCMSADNDTWGSGFEPINPGVNVTSPGSYCGYIDPNPISSVNNMGHNYFLSQNPYQLNSYAAFGEAYYNILNDLKLTTGLRFTEDQKHFVDIPSELLIDNWGYRSFGAVDQKWDRLTGRAALDWTPSLPFTDQTLIYASYAHGYKAGGANPPGAALFGNASGNIALPDHPLTFKPEYIESFELGTKNTLLDGSLTLNGDIFYYNYTGYQISEIVDRTAINNNYNAHVEGAELESNWEPLPGLKFNFAGGWEDTAAAAGDSSIDLMDRTAGNPNWIVVKPYPTQASNCILPTYVVGALLQEFNIYGGSGPANASVYLAEACGTAYNNHLDPLTYLPYAPGPDLTPCPRELNGCTPNGSPINVPPANYIGFNPLSAPNNGEGFSKNLSGHKLPNAPPFTVSFGTQYSIPVTDNWAATLRGDFYWQADSWARIFNDNPYDRIRGYTNVNLALILTSGDGWQVMGYVKNVFNTTAITGDFLNSDDSQLTTNVFLTDPRLYGVRITKNFGEGDTGAMADVENWLADLFADADRHKPTLWITLGGNIAAQTGQGEPYSPPFVSSNPNSPAFKPSSIQHIESPQQFIYDDEARVTFQPEQSDWTFIAQIRYGRAVRSRNVTDIQPSHCQPYYAPTYYRTTGGHHGFHFQRGCTLSQHTQTDFSSTQTRNSQSHAIIDFLAGKDVGLGLLGADDTSTVDFGVRIAQFGSKASSTIHGRPDLQNYKWLFPSFIRNYFHWPQNLYEYRSRFHTYAGSGNTKRSFRGIGPTISWNNSMPIFGNIDTGQLNVDWGANGAILFGRRRVSGQHHESGHYFQFKYSRQSDFYTHSPAPFARSKQIVVPNVGGFAGISVNYLNAKVSLGYRGDFFFGAMDGGWDQEKSKTIGLFGPYANLSIGF